MIGQAIGRRVVAFGVGLSYSDPIRRPEAESRLGATRRELVDLLATCDTVVLAADLRPGNRHLIGREAISGMKPGAVLVNIGCCSLVDEAAVAEALATGALGGFASDVFEFEGLSRSPAAPTRSTPASCPLPDATVLTPPSRHRDRRGS